MSPRDGRVLRRGLAAGALTWAVVGGGLGVGLARAGAAAVLLSCLLGLVAGGLVASVWLLAALALDVAGGEPPTRQRLLWTFAVVAGALLGPLLAAPLLLAAAGR